MRTAVRIAIFGLLVPLTCAAGVAGWRLTSSTEQALDPTGATPRERHEGTFRVMSLNVAHGRGLSFWQALLQRSTIAANLGDVSRVIAREAPDVVALQETDGPSVWSGYFDHLASLSAATGLEYRFRGHHGSGLWPFHLDYGTGILSRLPLTGSRSTCFGASWRDNKGFVLSTVRVPAFAGAEIDVVSVHLDFLRAEVRSRQIEKLIATVEGRSRALVIVGDFNCDFGETTCLPRLASALGLRAADPSGGESTYSSEDPNRRIDWILVSEPLAFRDYRTLDDRISDHRAVVADLEWL